MEFIVVFTSIAVPILVLGRWVWKIRHNDLAHIVKRLDRIESKLDRHIERQHD